MFYKPRAATIHTFYIYTHLVKNMFYLKLYLYIYEVHVTLYTCLIFVQRSIVYTHIIYAYACSFDSFISCGRSTCILIDTYRSPGTARLVFIL